jgi:hypothetical protein
MTHLTEVELVDLLDGALAASRERHLDECDSCRATATRMREAFARATDSGMPEPSPLFWEHFSARVHDGVRGAEPDQPSRWFGWAQGATLFNAGFNAAFNSGSTSGKWAMSGALLTLLLVTGVWAGVWRANAPVPEKLASPASTASVADGAPDADPDALDAFDPETDEAWALVGTVADDVRWDDAAADGFGVRPGSVEHAMVTLTGAERSELVRLLEAETKQPGA